MSISIRSVTIDDHQEWLPLFQGYIAFYQAAVPDDVVALTFGRLTLGDPHAHVGLCALNDDGRLIGIAHVLFHPSTWSKTGYCYLEDLFVHANARGQGVGRALIEAVYALADARGATRTYWTTQEFNAPARALYDQLAQKSPFVQYRRQL